MSKFNVCGSSELRLEQLEGVFSIDGLDAMVEHITATNAHAVIIEDYPADKYGSSCLLLGFSIANRPLHIQVSRQTGQSRVKIVTLYEPDPLEWVNFIERRR
jgi:hypothetical protein